jgi:hypothetical protein
MPETTYPRTEKAEAEVFAARAHQNEQGPDKEKSSIEQHVEVVSTVRTPSKKKTRIQEMKIGDRRFAKAGFLTLLVS